MIDFKVAFEFGSAELKPESTETLRRLGKALNEGYVKPNKRVFDNAKVSDHFAIVPGSQGIVGDAETVLGPMDSCTIAPGEVREIVNRSNHVCKMLVVIPYPPGAKP